MKTILAQTIVLNPVYKSVLITAGLAIVFLALVLLIYMRRRNSSPDLSKIKELRKRSKERAKERKQKNIFDS